MNRTVRGFIVLLGAVLIHITLGVLYCFGNFSTYIVSYLRDRTSYHNIRFTNTQWILTLMVVGQGSTMVLGGLLEKKIGTRFTIIIGCTIHTLVTALSYFAIASFYSLIVTYGVLFGFGVGIAYSPAMTLSIKWLPTFKGIVAGGVVAGFGLGAMVFNPIITLYINPNNTSPSYSPNGTDEKYFHDPDDKAILDRVPSCFLVMAAFFLALQTAGNLLLKEPPNAVATDPVYQDFHSGSGPGSLQNSDSASLISPSNAEDEDKEEYSPLDLLKKLDFWLLWLTFMCNNQGICYCSTYWKKFGQNFISDDIFLAAIGSAASVANAFSRIVWGAIGDKFGYRIAMCTLQLLFAALYFVMYYTQTGKWGYAIFVFCLFFCIGGSFSLLPAVTVRTFGTLNSTANYGLVFTSAVVGALLNLLLMNVFSDWSSQYKQWLMAAFLVGGFMATFFFKFRTRSVETPDGYTAVPYAD